MSSPAPFNDIRTRLEAANLGYPIAYPNKIFSPPRGPWLRLEVTSDFKRPIELGANSWQEDGTAYVDIFVPNGSGTDRARAIAEAVNNVFRGIGPGNPVYLGGSIGQGAVPDTDGMWWLITVTVDYQYQDIIA